ncbi:MAG: hypothetical protein RIG77_05670 [Cyclobacteriaceae bacterium]
MKKVCFLIVFLFLSQVRGKATDHHKDKEGSKYIGIVKTFADSLLSLATDRYGTRKTAMWASVINLNSLSVPIRNVQPTKGVRPHDRAVGGSNYYHDVMTMKAFDALSEITGNPKYKEAVAAYSKDFLSFAQNPDTGLMGWGEHLYYDFYRDTVSISESKLFDQKYFFGYPHEFLAWTPPWERLWSEDASRTQRAIEGVMWHFQGPDTKTYLFNRHANWNITEHQKIVMPWIKHSVLFAYSFAFLYRQTGNELWKKRAFDTSLLYWNLRDYETDLVFNCFYHATEQDAGKLPDMGSSGLYAYWMYKTAELLEDENLKDTAKRVIQAYADYGYNEREGFFYSELNLDGTPAKGADKANAWKIGYGSSSLFSYARAAAYLASKEDGDAFVKIAINCEKQIPGSPLPEQFTAFNLGEAINFYMDLYDLTGKKYYLGEARKYVDTGIERFYKNGLFSRQTHDDYYEAKLGIGDLVTGILRLGIVDAGLAKKLNKPDFSY